MRQWAAQRVERDAVGRIDLYNDQESDVAKGWRKEMWPLAAELSRPAPLDYPLPAFVQSYLEQAAKISDGPEKGRPGRSPYARSLCAWRSRHAPLVAATGVVAAAPETGEEGECARASPPRGRRSSCRSVAMPPLPRARCGRRAR